MREMKTILIFFITTATVWGQTDSLDKNMQRGEITTQEWYDLKLKSGYFSSQSSGWIQFTDQVDTNSDIYKSLKNKSGLIFYIPEKYQVIKTNGNRYIQAYLFNFTDTVVSIPRIDATIDNVENILFINGKWIKVKENSKSDCGNSYWTQKLEPNFYMSIQFDNHDISLGKIKVRQIIKLKIGGHILESREVSAMLNENQIKILRQR